jgi:predicted DNA-binding transcriptional regulator AlpA
VKNPTPKTRKLPRYGRLDGRPLMKPRGRHAVAQPADNDAAPRAVVTIPMTQRLGYRTSEFAHLCGVSVPTIWRQIRDGKIETVEIGGVKLIPRSFAIKSGLITTDDTV